MDTTLLGNRLTLLKKSGYADIMTSEYPSSLTLPSYRYFCNVNAQIQDF
jgi:hypothetical protein